MLPSRPMLLLLLWPSRRRAWRGCVATSTPPCVIGLIGDGAATNTIRTKPRRKGHARVRLRQQELRAEHVGTARPHPQRQTQETRLLISEFLVADGADVALNSQNVFVRRRRLAICV